MSALGDVALVVSIQRGQPAALAEAYARHSRAVRSIGQRLCGTARVDDLVQDVFLALWHHPERFDPDRDSLGAFLSMQARTRAIDQLRSDRARIDRQRREGRSGSEPARTTEDAGTASLEEDLVGRALAILPALQREVIVLAYFGGHTYAEVARLLRQPEGTIKARIRTGLRGLRRAVEDLDPGRHLLGDTPTT